ncbi:MAG: adenylyl-sulfate kinase, partial [Rhodospirillales bacterium]|nr:adenylyl-sulfate kinase [Rhodospirillales bacterium]
MTGKVVWITGFSGAGKTTISRRVVEILRERGENCILLDGDEIRQVFPDIHSGHDPERRLSNAFRNSALAKMIAGQGPIVVFATMSLFSQVQDWNRENFPAYLEVLVDVPLEVLKARDFNGLYSRAERGLIQNVVGVDMDYHLPRQPDLMV